MKAIRSSAFRAVVCKPESLPACSFVVITWRVGQYDSGREDIMIMLNLKSESIDPNSLDFRDIATLVESVA